MEKYSCYRNWILRPEQKWFSVAKISQISMPYFCTGRWARLKEYLGIFSDFWKQEKWGLLWSTSLWVEFQTRNWFFSFMKNIPWVILGFFRERMLNERWMGHLGENQGHALVFKSIWIDSKTPNSKQRQRSPEKERRQKPGFHSMPTTLIDTSYIYIYHVILFT